ncbi:MAG: OmpA family protein [Silicimonas sp.]|nr:OmpA family protein [Silicimonas sp.]
MNFSFDAEMLDAEATSRLDQQAEWIIDHPFAKIRVYGHTDKTGSEVYNDDLGKRRADQVAAYLISKGIDQSRLDVVLSYGEALPLVATEDRERTNRRVMTDVSGVVRVMQRDQQDRVSRSRSVQFVDRVPQIDSDDQFQVQEFDD